MKKYLLLLLGLLVTARAASSSNSSFTNQAVTIQNGDCEIAFWIGWWADDYPQNSAPGRLDLFDGAGALVGSVVASHYRDSGLSISASAGAIDGLSSNVGRFCPNGTPADGFVAGTWRLSGLPPDTYTLRSWSYATFDTMLSATGVWTDTYVMGVSATPPPPPPPPTPEPPPPPPPPVEYSLTTSASSGGSVTAGGLFPAGSIIGVSAAPDAAHYFAGWSGDAAGNSPGTTVYLDGDRWVFAQFQPKAAQAISFAAPANQPVGAPALPLFASSTSGLPVQISVVSGPATIADNILTITGPGTVTLQATQPGDGLHLPATPVLRSFSVSAPSVVRYQTNSRTLLANAEPGSHFVLRVTP